MTNAHTIYRYVLLTGTYKNSSLLFDVSLTPKMQCNVLYLSFVMICITYKILANT